MKKFEFVSVLAIGAATALSSGSATAGTYHHKRNIAPTVSERVRNAWAYSEPAYDFARDGRYYDEALAPPAGH